MKSIRKAEFTLKGLTPLLMHADNVEACDMLNQWRKDPANKGSSTPGDDRSPPWSWQTYWYLDDESNLTLPSDNLLSCLRKAGSRIILKKMTTFKELTCSGLQIPEDYLDFRNNGVKISAAQFVEHRGEKFVDQRKRAQEAGFDLLMKRAPVGTGKHVRVRPIFRNWTVSGELMVLAPEFDEERLNQLFTIAGTVGVGDWRPGSPKSPGRFGMFEATVKMRKD